MNMKIVKKIKSILTKPYQIKELSQDEATKLLQTGLNLSLQLQHRGEMERARQVLQATSITYQMLELPKIVEMQVKEQVLKEQLERKQSTIN